MSVVEELQELRDWLNRLDPEGLEIFRMITTSPKAVALISYLPEGKYREMAIRAAVVVRVHLRKKKENK